MKQFKSRMDFRDHPISYSTRICYKFREGVHCSERTDIKYSKTAKPGRDFEVWRSSGFVTFFLLLSAHLAFVCGLYS
ncbi:unnamed protein product [Urochloa humidicola]